MNFHVRPGNRAVIDVNIRKKRMFDVTKGVIRNRNFFVILKTNGTYPWSCVTQIFRNG
jgi:hypothetical protein